MQEQKGEEISVATSKSTAMNLSSHVPTTSSSAKTPIASKSPGILTATEKPESRRRRNSKSDAASSSQARLQDEEMCTFPILKLGVKKLWQGDRLLLKQLRGNPIKQTTREVQKLRRQNGHTINTCLQPRFTTWKQSSRSSGKSTDENMTTPWMVWTWIRLFGAYFWMPLDKTIRLIYDSWRIIFGIVWDRYSMKMKKRSYVDVDKLIVQPSFSNHQRQNMRLLRLCALRWKNGRWSCCDLEEQKWMAFRKQSLQGYEANRRHARGIRVENIHRNHNVGPPRQDSKSNDRPTVWTWALHREDHLHVNVQRHFMERRRKKERCEYSSQTVANYAR